MWWVVKQLAVPANYLRIRNGHGLFHSKRMYDLVLPVTFAAATCVYFGWLSISFAVFDHPVLVKRISDLLTLMIAFYMAALAAVATFDRKGIDNELDGDPALLSVRNPDPDAKEKRIDKSLSYRQFISYLFGYLSFLSLILYVFILAFDGGWRKFEAHIHTNAALLGFLKDIIDPLLTFILFSGLWQLIFTSLLGIYFLTERVQSLHENPPAR